MRDAFLASLVEQAAPVRGLRVLLWGFSGAGFPGGDGRAEAIEWLPRAGVEATYTNELDPDLNEKLSRKYDVSIVCNTRVGAVLKYDGRVWTCADHAIFWFWDLRPGGVAQALAGKPNHVFLSYDGPWVAPNGSPFDPQQWRDIMRCPVGYCPQAAPLREPVTVPDAPRVVFVGDVANTTYHAGRRELCAALGAKVLNAKQRDARLAIEAQLPGLYSSSRYCLSASPLAPSYTSVRTYSILACGGLMMLHQFPGADRLFRDGVHAVLFDTADEARARMVELDSDPEQRQRIADAGRRLHATKHTVAHRIVSICKQVTRASEDFDGWLS